MPAVEKQHLEGPALEEVFDRVEAVLNGASMDLGNGAKAIDIEGILRRIGHEFPVGLVGLPRQRMFSLKPLEQALFQIASVENSSGNSKSRELNGNTERYAQVLREVALTETLCCAHSITNRLRCGYGANGLPVSHVRIDQSAHMPFVQRDRPLSFGRIAWEFDDFVNMAQHTDWYRAAQNENLALFENIKAFLHVIETERQRNQQSLVLPPELSQSQQGETPRTGKMGHHIRPRDSRRFPKVQSLSPESF